MRALLERFRTSDGLILFIILLTVTTAAMETDVFVPSFPAMKTYFATTEVMIQLIVGINFLGICIASLFYGPLADAYGRRPVLISGCVIFTIASIGCLLSTSIETLLFWRFFQGIGTSASFVAPGAIIYDLYTKEEASKKMGVVNSLITLAMAGAPILGNYLANQWGWKANFILLLVLSLISLVVVYFGLRESHPVAARTPLQLKGVCQGYQQLMLHPQALGLLLIIGCVFSGHMVYISNLSLIFIDNLGIDQSLYGYYQGVVLLAFGLMSILSGKVIQRFGMHITKYLGMGLIAIGSTSLLIVSLVAPTNPLLITLSMSINSMGFALGVMIMFGEYMEIFPNLKGIASALSNATRLLMIALMVALSGIFFNGTIFPVAMMVFTFCILAFITQILLAKYYPTLEVKKAEHDLLI